MNKRQVLLFSNSPHRGAFQIAGAYLLIGGLWILFSDQVAARIALNEQMLTTISLYKGWGYVIVTALLLYWLIRRHTEAVRVSEEQLHRLIDAMPVFISYVDANRHYRFTNQTYKEWFGDPAEGKHVEEVIGKAAYRTVSKYIDKVLSGETTSYETEFPYQDEELFMTATYIPDKAGDGRVKGFFVMAQDLTAQRQAEDERRLWADAFEGCAHGIAIADPNTNRIVVCNPAFASLQKNRAEEIVGSAILNLYTAPDHERVRRNIEKADQIGHSSYEAHMVRRDGSAIPVQMDIVSVLGEDGELLHRVVTAQDISERKQAEENLRKNEERYRHLFENNPHPMWTYDLKTLAFLDVNEAAIQKYGYSRSEFLQMTIADIRPVEDVERLKEHLRQARPALQHSGGWRHRLKDGTVIDVEITSHIVEIDGHEAALVVAQEITERKRAEEKLKESEEKYRTLVEHLPVITYISGPDEYVGVSYISPQIESYGFDLNTWLADPEFWFRRIHPDDQDRVTSELQQFQSGAETYKAEYRLMLLNGEIKWFHDESIRVKDQGGKTMLKQGFMLDITERKLAEEVLYESEERYRLVSEITSDYAYKDRVEEDGRIVPEWITDSFTRITGYSIEDAHAPDFWQRLVHPDHRQLLLEHIQIVLSGQPDTREFHIITKSGELRWLRDYANPVWDAKQKRVATLYGAVQDVTERKQSEEESKSLARFPEENPNPVMRATYEGKVVYANAGSNPLLKDWGVKVGDYLPANWITLIENLIKTRSQKTIEVQCGETTYSFILAYAPNANDVNLYGRDITERKQAEEYLRRFELLSEHSRDIILFMDREDGRILEANAAAVQAYGYSREELLSFSVRDLRASDTVNLTADQMAQADAGGILFETIHRRKDGSTFPVEVSSQGANIGGVRTLISIIRDITERKQVEEALRLKDQLLHLTSEMAKVGGWEFDSETGKGTWTDEVARIHDIDPTRETNVEIGLGFYVGESREKIEQAVKGAIEFGKPYDLELEMVSAKGDHKWVRTMALPIVQNDKVVKVQGIFQDITERKQIEKALQMAHDELELKVQERTAALSEANALLQALMNNMPDHIYFKDLQSRFIRTSRSQASLLGLSDPAEVIGKTDFDFFPHATRSYAEEQEVMMSGKPLIDLEEWVVWPDGRETWVSTTKLPLRNAQGQTIGICGISHDITERKRTEQKIKQLNADLEKQAEKLQAANKELEAFSYSVSHDLRAPLRAIDGYTRILVEDYESILDAEGKRICGIISREARRMGQLIDDLLAFSRLGRKELYASRIDMRGMAVSVLNELLKEEERARLEFQIGRLPAARGDSSLIRQVWFNLLANAIKFTSRKERALIEIGSKTNKDELIYYVRDSGAGFDMEYANKLFGVFQRLHTESEFDGTGVGLAIVQRIIHRHEGRVWAEGEVGKGATFYFALPRKADHHE